MGNKSGVHMTVINASPSPYATIYFSTSAADRVASLIAEEGNPNLNLRVFITGGGCSGFKYDFTFDEKQEDDIVIEQNCSDGLTSVKLLIDSMSYQYLKNAKIDYVENIQGAQFIISNPNAKTTCGCGSSFSVGEEE
jgi:iron-sulfur cluster insertion protein